MKYCPKCDKETERSKSGACKDCGKRRRLERKITIMIALGGCICVGCGYAEVEELTIDHIKNNGHKHRIQVAKEMGWTFKSRGGDYSNVSGDAMSHYYAMVLKRDGKLNREEFQVLCPNCQSRKRNGKLLPNQQIPKNFPKNLSANLKLVPPFSTREVSLLQAS